MTGHLGLAIFLAGIAVGVALTAWILHRTDKRLEASASGQVGP